MSLKELATEQIQEISMIEMAYKILSGNKQAAAFQEIWEEIIEVTGMSEAEAKGRIAQFYTDLNIDGRFIALGEGRWGLRAWYPVDQIEDDTIAPAKSKKKKKTKKVAKKEDLDDYDEIEDEVAELEDEEIDDFVEEEEDLEDELMDDDEDLDDDDLDELDDEFEEDDEEENV